MVSKLNSPQSKSMNLEDYIDKFLNQEVKILGVDDIEKAKGKMSISNFTTVIRRYTEFTEIPEFNITIGNIDRTIGKDNYLIYSVNKIDDSTYCSLNIGVNEYSVESGTLYSTVPFSSLSITEVTKKEYEDFKEDIQSLDWTRIAIPPSYTGKDKLTEADAFELMCQEIVSDWGAKNFRQIGKGPDRARDGIFEIEADSWIPITTNYSNLWILQCKYSQNYANLTESEIYSEITKVLMHKPDYYLLMTNRKITSDFSDWFDSVFRGNKYHIPFKSVLIGQKQLEQILAMPAMQTIRQRYFGV